MAAVRLLELEFVVRAFADAGQENFPDAAAEQLAHRMHAAVPAVEIADHADALRIRRPDVEASCRCTPSISVEMRAEFVVELPVLALGEEMQIERPEDRAERIRIALRPLVAVVRR